MQVGVQLPRIPCAPRQGGKAGYDLLLGQDLLEFTASAERAGFDHLQHSEHVLGAHVRGRPDWHLPWTSDDAFHEPFVTLSYLAGRTRLNLMSSVLVLPQRQTAVVAKQAAMLDLLSEQRLRLGVAIGRNDWEYANLGARFEDRAQRLEEQVAVLRALWTEEPVTLEGTYHHLVDAALNPRPRRAIPIWMGGGAQPYATKPVRSALTRVARLADGWISLVQGPGRLPVLEEALTILRSAVAEAGRDVDAFGVEGAVGYEPDMSSADFQERLEYQRDLGVSHLSVYFHDPRDKREQLNEQVMAAGEIIRRVK